MFKIKGPIFNKDDMERTIRTSPTVKSITVELATNEYHFHFNTDRFLHKNKNNVFIIMLPTQ